MFDATAQHTKAEHEAEGLGDDHAKRTWPHTTPLGITNDRQLRAFFLPALRESDWDEGFPVPTKLAVELLDRLDYVVAEGTLVAAVENAAIPLPSFKDGELLWEEDELLAAATYLELRQAWKPASIRHDAKKGRWRTLAELADAVGTPEAHARLSQFDTARLLTLLMEHDCREVREAIGSVLFARLRQELVFSGDSDEAGDTATEGDDSEGQD
jgi:hypothetical protein